MEQKRIVSLTWSLSALNSKDRKNIKAIGYLGEIAEAIVEHILEDMGDMPLNKYKFGIDFAVADDECLERANHGEALESMQFEMEHWYGMKSMELPFDSSDLCILADYYGGSCLSATNLYSGQLKVSMVKAIKDLIQEVVRKDGETLCTENTVLYIESVQ